MIIKERKVPEIVKILEALKRRLPANHPKYHVIVEEHFKRKAGYKGEVAVDHYLNQLPKEEYILIHDLRLANGSSFFQIDTLLLTTRYFLIVEVKNLAGTLYFEKEANQLTRKMNEIEEGFLDPISQGWMQKKQLNQWIRQHSLPNMPLDFFIVISNPRTIPRTQPNNLHIFEKVVHAHALL